MLAAAQSQRIGLARVAKKCKICSRNCNEQDPVDSRKKLRWANPQNKAKALKVDADSGLEVVNGKVDYDCNKAFQLLVFV